MTEPWTSSGAGVLVTGAQGFMGSWLSERLLADGARVLVPRRPAPEQSHFRRRGLDNRCEQIDLDLADLPSLIRAVNENDVELIFHLAAQTIVAKANESPAETLAVNVGGTYNLLEAVRLLRPDGRERRVVVASSYHAYGRQPGGGAYAEDTALRPTYPYDVSKACADMLGRSYATTYGMPVGVTRIANVFGGGDLNWSRIVPDSARAIASGHPPVISSDGTPQRDYLYVEDAVEGYLAVARSLTETQFHARAWNIGMDAPVSVIDIVQALIDASGRDLEPDIRGQRGPRDEIDSQYLDSSAIRNELGWSPRWELEPALARTFEHYLEALTETETLLTR